MLEYTFGCNSQQVGCRPKGHIYRRRGHVVLHEGQVLGRHISQLEQPDHSVLTCRGETGTISAEGKTCHVVCVSLQDIMI